MEKSNGNGYKDVRKENARMKNNNFLRIPINRIIALILLDIMSIIVASVGALYIRFDFNFSSIPVGYFEKLENVIAFNIIVTLVFFALWKLYKSVWRYASATELLNIIFATTCPMTGHHETSAPAGGSRRRSHRRNRS